MKIIKRIVIIFVILIIVKYVIPKIQNNTIKNDHEKIKTELLKDLSIINQNTLDFESTVKNTNYKDILNLTRLKKDKNLKESKKIIAKIDSSLTFIKTANPSLIDELLKKLDSKKESGKIGESFYRSSLKTIIKLNLEQEQDYNIFSKQLESTKSIINLLENCKYTITNSQILFDNQKCLNQYNSLITKFNSEVKESKEIKFDRLSPKEKLDFMKNQMEELNKPLNIDNLKLDIK